MSLIKTERLESAPESRTVRLLQLEHRLIQRYVTLVAEIYSRENAWCIPQTVSSLVLEFGEDFLEGRHFLLHERVVELLQDDDDAAAEALFSQLDCDRDSIRLGLEGMRKSLEDAIIGAATSFGWNAQSFARHLKRFMQRAEELTLPLIESKMTEALDRRLARHFGFDEIADVSEYAQAENTLMILERI